MAWPNLPSVPPGTRTRSWALSRSPPNEDDEEDRDDREDDVGTWCTASLVTDDGGTFEVEVDEEEAEPDVLEEELLEADAEEFGPKEHRECNRWVLPW